MTDDLAKKLLEAQRRIKMLEKEVETLGDLADACTYDVLGKVCSGCRRKCPHFIDMGSRP